MTDEIRAPSGAFALPEPPGSDGTAELDAALGTTRTTANGGAGRIPFRVRIAVTGHRVIPRPDAVGEGVRARLREVRAMFTPTPSTPVVFTLLSALAEGADRIAATVALDELADADLELAALLPLKTTDYVTDFATEASRQEFTGLLERASTTVEFADRRKPGARERNAAYQRVGYYIAERCDVLIAVWDGEDPRGPGGTADVVEHAVRSGVPVLVVSPDGSLRNDGIVPEPLQTPRYEQTLEALRRLDQYNCAALSEPELKRHYDEAEHTIANLLGEPELRREFRPVARWALPRMVRADQLAMRYQAHYRNLARVVHFLAAFAVTAVAAQTIFAPDHPAWLSFEIALLCVLIALLWWGRRSRVHERWLGYRSLAEAFRGATFIVMCGSPAEGDPGVRGRIAQTDEPWFQRAFSEAWRDRPRVALKPAHAADLRHFLLAGWLDDQIEYHHSKAQEWQQQRNRYTRTIGLLAMTTIVLATLHITGWSGHTVEKWLGFLAITLPGFGAAVTGLREHAQPRLHQERSLRMAQRLERLKFDLEQGMSLTALRRLAVEIQRVMAEENLDWSGVMEFQELELVI